MGKAKRTRHQCLVQVDTFLANKNTKLVVNLFNDNQVIVETQQIETGRGKKKRVTMVASYCPFCGQKLN